MHSSKLPSNMQRGRAQDTCRTPNTSNYIVNKGERADGGTVTGCAVPEKERTKTLDAAHTYFDSPSTPHGAFASRLLLVKLCEPGSVKTFGSDCFVPALLCGCEACYVSTAAGKMTEHIHPQPPYWKQPQQLGLETTAVSSSRPGLAKRRSISRGALVVGRRDKTAQVSLCGR